MKDMTGWPIVVDARVRVGEEATMKRGIPRYRIGDMTRMACALDGPRDGDPDRERARDALDRLAAGEASVADARLLREWIGGSPAGCGGSEFAGGDMREVSAVKRTVRKLDRLIGEAERCDD